VSEHALRRINALLKLSGDNPNEHEAEAAAVKAQEMMLSEGITMLDVTRYDADHNVVKLEADHIEVFMDTGKSRNSPTWQAMLAFTVARTMGGKAVRWASKKGYRKSNEADHRGVPYGMGSMVFVGLNVEGIVDIFHYLRMMLDVNSAQAMRNRPAPPRGKSPAEGRSYRLAWIAGCVESLEERLDEQYNRIESESGTALVLVRDLVDEKVKELFPRMNNIHVRQRYYGGAAFNKGAEFGRNMDIGAAKLGGDRRQIGA